MRCKSLLLNFIIGLILFPVLCLGQGSPQPVYDQAVDIQVEDVGDYFEGTDVEAVLQELGAGGTGSTVVNWEDIQGTQGAVNVGGFGNWDTIDQTKLEGINWDAFQPIGDYLTSESDTLQSVTTRGSSTDTGMTIAGNVGIGTVSPLAALDVYGDIILSYTSTEEDAGTRYIKTLLRPETNLSAALYISGYYDLSSDEISSLYLDHSASIGAVGDVEFFGGTVYTPASSAGGINLYGGSADYGGYGGGFFLSAGSGTIYGGDNEFYGGNSTLRGGLFVLKGGDADSYGGDIYIGGGVYNAVFGANGIYNSWYEQGGSGYVVSEELTVDGGDGEARFIVAEVDGSGTILSGDVFLAGSGYSAGVEYDLIGGYGNGSGGTVYVETVKDTSAGNVILGFNNDSGIFVGNVGVGTSVPTALLEVNGDIVINGGLKLSTDASDGYVFTSDADGNGTWQEAGGSSQWTTNGSDIYYSTGNVGIGSAAPTANLTVNTTADFNTSSVTPYDANTLLLVHYNGSDGATSYTAETGQTVTFAGTAQLDTAQFKWGSSAVLLDGDSDYTTLPANASWNMGTGNFTFDLWFKLNENKEQYFVAQRKDGDEYWRLGYSGSNTIYMNMENVSAYIGPFTGTFTYDTNWHHLAFVRNGTAFDIYIDGIDVGGGTDSDALINLSAYTLDIGKSNTIYYNGWIDEVRVSNVARWTTNFSTPVQYADNSFSNAIKIDSNGNVGIGDSTPLFGLEVVGKSLAVSGTGSSAGDAFKVNSNATVGIGTSNPTSNLQVDGTVSFRTTSGLQGFYQNSVGNVAIGGTVPGTSKLYVNGNIGIGSTNPTQTLSLGSGSIEFKGASAARSTCACYTSTNPPALGYCDACSTCATCTVLP